MDWDLVVKLGVGDVDTLVHTELIQVRSVRGIEGSAAVVFGIDVVVSDPFSSAIIVGAIAGVRESSAAQPGTGCLCRVCPCSFSGNRSAMHRGQLLRRRRQRLANVNRIAAGCEKARYRKGAIHLRLTCGPQGLKPAEYGRLRGAEAPLFHGCAGRGGNPALSLALLM